MLNSKLTMLLLIAIITILGNTIYYLLKKPQENPATELAQPPANLKLKTTPTIQAQPLANMSEYEEIIERPLFSSNRQPEEETVEQETVQRPVRNPDLKLAGIVISNEENVALIKSRKEPKLQRLKLEEKIDGWKLIAIKSNSVKLESGNDQITLDLTRKADPAQIQKNKTNQQIPVQKQPIPQGVKPSQSDLRNHNGMKTIPGTPSLPVKNATVPQNGTIDEE